MKNAFMISVMTVLVAVLAASPLVAATNAGEETPAIREKLVANAKWALQSANHEVRLSTIGHIQTYKLKELAGYLENVLRSDAKDEVRIAAAIAMMEVCEKAGLECVKSASVDNSSPAVRRFLTQMIVHSMN